ncbi:unnamed protein product [Enterobius vermicularis]|uniref:Leucine-rich repeat protein n=1 Tax=Enterobius vermicularis TaxID=51028 RepID=A0A0N4VAK7_ENTVE|nr:unnamed protein product [Enterobius vermicularis]
MQNSNSTDRRRPTKGIISIAKSKGSSADKFELRLSTPKDIRGRLLEINRETVRSIQSKFVNSEGKETSVGPEQAVKSSDFALSQRLMTITNKDQYPKYPLGFPPGLQSLRIVGLQLQAVDSRWFSLNALQRLDLSQNLLGSSRNFGLRFLNIVRLKNLLSLSLAANGLTTFSVGFDDLSRICFKQEFDLRAIFQAELWDSLPVSLVELDLSFNEINHLSPLSTRLVNLSRLNISNNRLRSLPDEICFFRSLRFLDASNNQISFVPGCLGRMKFDLIDFSGNVDLFSFPVGSKSSNSSVASLVEIGAAAVKKNKLPTHILPWDLRFFLSEYTAVCSICLNIFPKSSTCSHMWVLNILSISSTVSHNRGEDGRRVKAEFTLCPSCSTGR